MKSSAELVAELESVAVIGLGKVGSVLAALHLSVGRKVYAFDSNPDVSLGFQSKCLTGSYEQVVRDSIQAYGSQLTINDFVAAAKNCRIFEFIVPTPSLDNGSFDASILENALVEMGRHLDSCGVSNIPYFFVVKSTVSPGTCRKLQVTLSEAYPLIDIRIVYNPEFIALGEVAKGMQYPDLSILGAHNPLDTELIFEHSARTRLRDVRYFHLDFEAAEIAKLAVNTFVTTKISFANLIGQLISSISESKPSLVLEAIGSDPRIGHRYLSPGLGYGGPCFPRDNAALAHSLLDRGLPAELPAAVDAVNRFMPPRVVSNILGSVDPGSKVLVLGLSYKPGTDVIIESQALMVCEHLAERGIHVEAYDPMVKHVPDASFRVLTELPELSLYDRVFCAVAWPEFSEKLGSQGITFLC